MATLAADTFTRSDAATLGSAETGGAYTLTGSWRVVSGKGARAASVTTTNTAFLSSIGSNIDASVDITSFGINDGLMLRVSDVNNYLLVSLDSAGLNLWKNVAGVFTKLDNFTFTITSGTTYTLRVVLVGSAYQVYLSGTLRLSGTLTGTAATLSGTGVGYRSAGAANSSTYDNLLVVNAVTATAIGTLTLTGSGTSAVTASATGSLTLTGSGSTTAPTTAAGSLTLTGTGTPAAPATSTASLTLTGASTAAASMVGSGQLSLTATASTQATATSNGTLSLTGQAAGTAASSSGASLTLTGQAAAAAPVVGGGSITLTGSGSLYASTGAVGTITLTGIGSATPALPPRDIELIVGAPFTSWTATQPFHGWTADAPTAGEWTAGAPETGWTAGVPATEAWTAGPVRI